MEGDIEQSAEPADSSRESKDTKHDAAAASNLPAVVVRRKSPSARRVDIPRPRRSAPTDTSADSQSLAATEAERDRQLERKYAGTTPHGRQLIRMKLYAIKRTLRNAQATAGQELATLEKHLPPPISLALLSSGAGLITTEMFEQAVLHLQATEQTQCYLGSVMRLVTAFAEIRQMPEYHAKAHLVGFYCALADRLAQTRPEQQPAAELDSGHGLNEAQQDETAAVDIRQVAAMESQAELPQGALGNSNCPTGVGPDNTAPDELTPRNHPVRGFSLAEARRRGFVK